MAHSILTYPGDGTTTQFALNFTLGYLSRDHIQVRVGNEVDGSGNPVYRAVTYVNDNLIDVQGAVPAIGEDVVITRTVDPTLPYNDWADDAIIDELTLDENQKQALMLMHEILDGRISSIRTDLDMGNNAVTMVKDPVNLQDAANKQYVDGLIPTGASNAAAAQAAQAAAETARDSASASASSAAASWDSFDDIYLGSKASDPTLDNDGDPLTEGRLYWNSTTKNMRTYTGTVWVDSYNGYLGIDDNAAATVITLDNAGKTGIGGTPASFFHVNSGAVDEVGRFEGTGTPYLSLYDTGVRQGYWYSQGTRIELAAEAGNDLSLLTADVSRMFIESATGSVGVGDTSPESHYGNPYRFLARHDQNAATRMGITNAVSGASAEVLFGMIGGTANSFMNQKLVDNSGAPYFQFDIGSGVDHLQFSTAGAEKMRLTQAGNFGIGTSSPSEKLEVAGNTEVSIKLQEIGGNALELYQQAVDSYIFADAALRVWSGGAERLTVLDNGSVGIGNTGPAGIFEIGDFSATGASEGVMYAASGRFHQSSAITTAAISHWDVYNPNGLVGSVQSSGTSTLYNTTSDYRLKVTFGEITDATALDKVMALPIYDLAFKENPLAIPADDTIDPDSRQISALAHEVQALFPWAVTGEKDAVDEDGDPIWQMVDPSKLVYAALAAIQELKRENTALRLRIEALEAV